MLETIVNNVEAAISNGRTDVMLALIENYQKSKHVEPVKDGVPLGTVLNSLLTEKGTFLHFATALNQPDIVRSLLLSGADPTVRNGSELTALELASTPHMRSVYEQELVRTVAASDVRRIEQLLSAGLSVNCRDSRDGGNTPLHWAVTYADVGTVVFLLDRGADANAANCSGATPLHDAVVRGDPTIVQELLVRGGASMSSRATNGKFANHSPMSLAHANPEILTILQDHSLNQSPDIDLEQNSDTSSSWVNECGSRESLITVEVDEDSTASLNLHSEFPPRMEYRQVAPLVHHRSPTVESIALASGAARDFAAQLETVWPTPLHLELTDETVLFPSKLKVYCIRSRQLGDVHKVARMWRVHEKRLTKLGIGVEFEGTLGADCHAAAGDGVVCHVQESIFSNPREAYKLTVSGSKIQMVAGDGGGLYYATCLLVQLLEAFANMRMLPGIKALDWPEWHCRGILIKTAPKKSSINMATILSLIETASYFRVNHLFVQLELGDRQTLTLPYPQSAIISLDKMCNKHSVSLTPAIELDEALTWTVTLQEIQSLLAGYLTCFTSKRYLYVGPLLSKLLLRISKEAGHFPALPVSEETCLILDATYVDSRECNLADVPFNATLLNQCQRPWNNQELSSFQRKAFKKGLPRSVMLCSSLGNSLVGHSVTLYDAWQQVCRRGGEENSTAVILDYASSEKYGVLPSFQWPGLTVAAGLTWNSNSSWGNVRERLPRLLDSNVFGGNRLGDALMLLAEIDGTFGGTVGFDGCTFPYQLLTRPDTVSLDGLTAERLQKSVREIKATVAAVAKLRSDDLATLQTIEEIYLTADVLLFCYRMCRSLVNVGQNPSRATGLAVINVGVSNLPPTSKTDLANKLLELRQRFQKIWLARHLPDGFHLVLRTFHVLLHQLIPQVSSDSIIEI